MLWVGQGSLAAVVAYFVWHSLSAQWDEFRSLELDLTIRLLPVVGAALIVLGVYTVLIGAWWAVLRGWKQELRYRDAVRIWSISNLGRYLPGKVWSVAGLAALAQGAGVSAWAAVGSAIAMQALAVASGVGVVAATLPGVASPIQLGAVGLAAVTVLVVLMSPRVGEAVARAIRSRRTYHPLPVGVGLLAYSVTVLSWIAYGVAFWLLAHSVIHEPALPVRMAIGVFAGGYIVGLLAIFAPGGIGVREVVYIAALTPSLGAGGAIVVSVASRLLLTATEIIAALVGLALGARTTERSVGPGQR